VRWIEAVGPRPSRTEAVVVTEIQQQECDGCERRLPVVSIGEEVLCGECICERGRDFERSLSTQPNPIGDREQLQWIAGEALNVLAWSLKPGASRETVSRKLDELRAALEQKAGS
jgi:hypothetical protein